MRTCLLFASFAATLWAQITLDVRVYDWASVPAPTLDQASGVVVRIFRASGIEVRWIIGTLDSPEARHEIRMEPPRPGREQQAICDARQDIALSILPHSSSTIGRGLLGYAEPLAPEGINATVFFRRVAAAAEEHGVPAAVLLGHAIAHEIGHVLLRTASHRKSGIMSGGWGEAEFREIRTWGMFFTAADARSMQGTILGLGCGATRSKTVRQDPPEQNAENILHPGSSLDI
jgi:hypothetical protein